MKAKELNTYVQAWLRNETRQRQQRGYPLVSGVLGMSQIGGCELAAYRSMSKTVDEGDAILYYGLAGRMVEDTMMTLIHGALGYRQADSVLVTSTPPIVAEFDQRFMGHADGILLDAEGRRIVVDVKSVGYDKLLKIRRDGIYKMGYAEQLWMYQRHMRPQADGAMLVFLARDVPWTEWPENNSMTPGYVPSGPDGHPAIHIADVQYRAAEAEALDDKACRILAAYDQGVPPACTCGWCERIELDF